MYGIIACSNCQRKRIIDPYDSATKCPYCGQKATTKDAAILYRNEDQDVVRNVLDASTGFVAEEKHIDENIDPMSTLEYRVEHTSDTVDKMRLIAEGLTRIKGSFTEDDVEALVPGKGQRFIKAMLDECMIYEVRYGVYKM